jgi:BirA family biotin operon repressor/biotin-[acetyl-CoA-carboxylase] ligase
MLKPNDPPPQTLSLGAGVALIEAVEAAVPGRALMLKWPNDLLLDGLKLAGILLERSRDRVVVGFGVNLAAAPELPDRQAAALDGVMAPEDFAPLLAASLARLLVLWRSGDPAAVTKPWLARAHPLGAKLTAHVNADERVTGTFDGLEPDGALRLRTGNGVQIVRAGDVSL